MRFVVFAVVVMIAGCQETVHCGPGVFGRNCDQSRVVRDAGADTGMDAGSEEDADVDANLDAFSDPCESCTADQDCYAGGDDSGRERGCVECLTSDGCPLAGTDGGAPGAFVCVNFECVFGCETDVDCGGLACRPSGECSEFARAQDVCEPCDTDLNCMGATSRCVMFDNAGHPGSYCLSNSDGVACGDRRRFTLQTSPRESVDGALLAAYCIPASATCQAVLDADTACTTTATCGLVDGLGTGICVGGTYCTYSCNTSRVDSDCPIDMSCDGASSACTR